MMFHLEYNAIRGFFSWSELGCLCRALGFQPDLLVRHVPPELNQSEVNGLSVKELIRLINMKYFDAAVDKSFNAHTADWNLCVFRKASVLIDAKVLTYEELNEIRMAYFFYEHIDMKGLELNEKILLRCLKICGRVIAPLKMQHRIKHMSQGFDEEGRIQLYEFLDLILWTELYDTHKVPPPSGNNQSKRGPVYQVDDFTYLMKHYDEKLCNYLNELYLEEEWSFSKETFSKQKLPNELPVNRDFRLQQVAHHKKAHKELKQEVAKSQSTVHRAATGYVRPRPLTAPNTEKFDMSEKSSIHTMISQHKVTVGELVRDYIQTPRTVRSASPRLRHSNQECSTVSNKMREPVEPAVTTYETKITEGDIQDLRFKMTTLNLKYQQSLHDDLKFMVPSFPIDQLSKKEEPPPPTPKKKNYLPALQPDNINKLAYAPYRPKPRTSHAKQCDARYRGWHPIKAEKGKHYVLTTTSFSSSPTSMMLGSLHYNSVQEVHKIRGDCVIRKTTEKNVQREINRPVTAPGSVQVLSTNDDDVFTHKWSFLKPTSEMDLARGATAPAEVTNQAAPNVGLETIREGNEESKPASAEDTSSVYSWGDFHLYENEAKNNKDIEKKESANEKKEESAEEVTNIRETFPIKHTQNSKKKSHSVVIKNNETASKMLHFAQEPLPENIENRRRQEKQRKAKKMANRRELSGYFRARLLKTVIS